MKGAEAGLQALKVLCDNRKQPQFQFLLLPPGIKEGKWQQVLHRQGPSSGAHSHARLWETSPTGACLGQVGLSWVPDHGQGQPGLVVPRRPWQPGRKEAPLPCWGSQGVGARLSREGRATRSFPAHSSRWHLGWREWERSCTCSPQQTKPDIPPTCTEENGQVGFWLAFFFFYLKSLIFISVLIDNLFPRPWSSKAYP